MNRGSLLDVIEAAILSHWNGEDAGAPMQETIEKAVREEFDVRRRERNAPAVGLTFLTSEGPRQ